MSDFCVVLDGSTFQSIKNYDKSQECFCDLDWIQCQILLWGCLTVKNVSRFD
jgi:hypothetical protein